MAVLSQAQRNKLPSKSFALPGKGEGPKGKGSGSYPIPDRGHARAALSRVSQFGSPAEKATVRAKVKSKFGMGGGMSGMSGMRGGAPSRGGGMGGGAYGA